MRGAAVLASTDDFETQEDVFSVLGYLLFGGQHDASATATTNNRDAVCKSVLECEEKQITGAVMLS